jgi:hypothetical protein
MSRFPRAVFGAHAAVAVAALATTALGCAASPSPPPRPKDGASAAGPASAPETTAGGMSTVAPSETATSFAWPKPDGWKSETIPFPLEFAPTLDYGGLEEIRFAPRFFAPASETYFSYSFAWVLERPAPIDAERLSRDFETYFAGLSRAVKPARFDAKAHHARLASSAPGRYHGTVQTVDSFGDGRALELHVDGRELTCGKRRILLFTLSPHPVGDATWATLLAQRDTFRCAS